MISAYVLYCFRKSSILQVLSKDRLRCGPSCIVGPEDRAAKSAAAWGFLPIRGRAGCSLCKPHQSGAGPADFRIPHQRTSIASCSGFKALGALKALQGAHLTLLWALFHSLDAQLLCQTNLVVLLLFLLCILLHCLAVFGHFWKYCQQRRNLSSHCLCNQLNALILLPYAPLTLFLILICSWHFSLIFCMFQNHHVLPVRTSWECLLLLCCFPFHSVVIESWFYFCDIYVFGVQLH